jgi:hypothetical protein
MKKKQGEDFIKVLQEQSIVSSFEFAELMGK